MISDCWEDEGGTTSIRSDLFWILIVIKFVRDELKQLIKLNFTIIILLRFYVTFLSFIILFLDLTDTKNILILIVRQGRQAGSLSHGWMWIWVDGDFVFSFSYIFIWGKNGSNAVDCWCWLSGMTQLLLWFTFLFLLYHAVSFLLAGMS